MSFGEIGLDKRILKAIADLGFANPTLIQQRAIPPALEGRDLLVRAPTGSGKTMSYAIPLLQHVLETPRSERDKLVACVIVPTKELCEQAGKVVRKLTKYCREVVRSATLCGSNSKRVNRSLLASTPHIVLATPTSLIRAVEASHIALNALGYLVIDEADLVLSYGHQQEMEKVSE